MDYKFKINDFEGPLDLLLHLIKESNINIYDLKLEIITKQYLDYIKAMEQINLSIASEYLVMAAELIEMKSKSLLPQQFIDSEDGFEEDPREALIQKLIDYNQYKEITGKFKELENTRQQIYTKIPSDVSNYSDKPILVNDGETTITDLLDAFSKFLDKQEEKKPLNTKVTIKELSLNDRVKSIRAILNNKKRVSFEDLFETYNRDYVIITFLSILEMAKQQEINIKQDYSFDKIYLELKGSE
ncbi:MAG: segregation/condensation protein A [Bacilli bacterium]|nr:segregation/condensation protein A [Bacilli bacterium]